MYLELSIIFTIIFLKRNLHKGGVRRFVEILAQ